jgi:hypothetical protein
VRSYSVTISTYKLALLITPGPEASSNLQHVAP